MMHSKVISYICYLTMCNSSNPCKIYQCRWTSFSGNILRGSLFVFINIFCFANCMHVRPLCNLLDVKSTHIAACLSYHCQDEISECYFTDVLCIVLSCICITCAMFYPVFYVLPVSCFIPCFMFYLCHVLYRALCFTCAMFYPVFYVLPVPCFILCFMFYLCHVLSPRR